MKTKETNYINLDCSKMNSSATIELASKIVEILKDKYSDYNALVKITVKADID